MVRRQGSSDVLDPTLSDIGNDILSVSDEIDLSGDGIQPQRHTYLCTEFKQETTEDGNLRAVFTFETPNADDSLPLGVARVTIREWLKHSNSKAQQIGRGILKRYGKALLGRPAIGPDVVGKSVSAEVFEDDAGFIRLRRLRAATATAASDSSPLLG